MKEANVLCILDTGRDIVLLLSSTGYNAAFWTIVLLSATDFVRLVLYSLCVTFSAALILVILLTIFNKSEINISEYIFFAFWGIFSYFTNCSIRMPTSEDVTYGSQIFSPEAGSLRYFAISLIIASEKDCGHFAVWLIAVMAASVLLNYLHIQMHSTQLEGIPNEYSAGALSKVLSCCLLFLVLVTSYMHCSSIPFFITISLMTFFRINIVIKSVEKKIKHQDNYDLCGRLEVFYFLLLICCVGAYIFFVKLTHLHLFSVQVLFLSIETVFYLYTILGHLWILRSDRHNFWKNTTAIPKSKKGEQCPVCLADIWTGRVTSCGHVFHSGCLARCLNQSSVCPMCRSNIGAIKKSR